MERRAIGGAFGAGLGLAAGLAASALFAEAGAAHGPFSQDVLPTLEGRCWECHGAAKQKGGLRLDSPEAILRGGDSGAAIVAGKSEESALLKRIAAPDGDEERMPPKGERLSAGQAEAIRKWIEVGAKFDGWSGGASAAAAPASAQTSFIPAAALAGLPERKLAFNRDIRPILADNCFRCHGPDKNARKGELRLDQREDAVREREGGRRAIVPGDPAKSELVRLIFSDDPDERMPSKASNKSLSEEEKKTLAAWIAQGAEYEPHWVFIPPQPQVPPASAAHPIDGFINAKLAELGMEPAPRADPITLARRASFDLTGLPPTPERVAAFAAAPTDAAWGALVDELLASPQYGERMAVDWLDQVRYADTNGYHSDETRSVWPYRDYVINAFNSNKPYNQFAVEQIAGDLLPGATREQMVASGFNRMNQITAEGGAQAKEYRAKYNADRVRAISSVWLGATMGCAECHDHKFDPYTMKDFYSMAAFFADLDEDDVYPGEDDWAPILRLPTDIQAGRLAALEALIKDLEEIERKPAPELAEGQRRWEARMRERPAEQANQWMPCRPSAFESAGGAELSLQDDLSILSSGVIPFQETYTVTIPTGMQWIAGVRVEALSHPDFKKGVTRLRGLFYLNEFEVEVAAADGTAAPVAIASAKDDSKGIGAPAAKAIDGDMLSAWFRLTPPVELRKTVIGTFMFREPIPGGPGTKLTVRLRHQGGAMYDRAAFARIRFSLTTNTGADPKTETAAPEIVMAAAADPAARSPELAEQIAAYYRTIAPELDEVRAQIAETREKREALLRAIPTTLISKALPRPRVTRALPRGNWQDDSGEVVAPATPAFLPPMKSGNAWATRMDLAQWIVAPENPLTARVYANRLWKLFFGRGLSAALEDLGAQGEWPSHPELLDWLAIEFQRSGWDMKHMVRLIVSSEAYRRSSAASAAAREADPDNRWLARQAAIRNEAETIRDTALAVGGLLNATIGGPSVKPYQPAGYWENMNFPKRSYQADAGAPQYRRGLYVHWQRSFLHPSMKAFDAPSREECTARRTVSNSPLQALTLLNDPTYVEAARAFAERIVREGGDDPGARLAWAFRQALSRAPGEEEFWTLAALWKKHRAQYEAEPDAATAALAVGQLAAPSDLDKAELAAWMSVARTLLNLHGTITRS